MDDLVAIIAEIIRLNNTQEPADDIDSLSNRRVRMVGELVQRQFRLGMLRLQRNILDRMSRLTLKKKSHHLSCLTHVQWWLQFVNSLVLLSFLS